ncbi:dipeptidase [Temperatibacter marinus]|uniref:Dipeptidase n=1 Tax=Temperatibacter marinus TaxID=1456591 RepID=A0AA52EF91_9PROT|nr:dipeptidase [Temperatibacter marinus]WND01459.1 dipeptidase [Temperatibacter marinus]
MEKFNRLTATLLIAFSLTACDTKQETLDEKANRIAQNVLIVDTHIDVPYRLNDGWEDVHLATEKGDFDFPRAQQGGLNVPFMSIYTPANLGDSQASTDHAHKMIDIVEKMAKVAPNKFTVVKTVAEAEKAFKEGKIALPLGMENGSPINNSLENLEKFYERGIRYITLAHSKTNHISDSSYDKERQYETGLSQFGENLIGHMNRMGIMVDISHVSDKAFYRAVELSKVPVIATHSSARHFTPGFERNMSDEMIKKLVETGGLIMINYGSAFLTEDANTYRSRGTAAYEASLQVAGSEDSDELRKEFIKNWTSENPYPFADISDVLNHIDHVVKVTGTVDGVGLGSDYDGVGNTLPTGLKDAASYPNLVKGLLERGYTEEDIGKILSGNILRVWKQTEEYAAKN